MKISCPKSCKWPGNGKPLAAGSTHKPSLRNKTSLHWDHTNLQITVLTLFFTSPRYPWAPPLVPKDLSLVTFNGHSPRDGLEVVVVPAGFQGGAVPSPKHLSALHQNADKDIWHWAVCPHSCPPQEYQLWPQCALFLSPFNLNSWLFNPTGLWIALPKTTQIINYLSLSKVLIKLISPTCFSTAHWLWQNKIGCIKLTSASMSRS